MSFEDSTAFPTLGVRVYVSDVLPGTHDVAGFDAVTGWAEIMELVDVGEYNNGYSPIVHNPVNREYVHKFHGSRDDGDPTFACARSMTPSPDSGQTKLIDAIADKLQKSFKVEYLDNPNGTSNTIDYFVGKVFNAPVTAGGGDSMVNRNFAVGIEKTVITKDAVT
jgi:hypothetical protein